MRSGKWMHSILSQLVVLCRYLKQYAIELESLVWFYLEMWVHECNFSPGQKLPHFRLHQHRQRLERRFGSFLGVEWRRCHNARCILTNFEVGANRLGRHRHHLRWLTVFRFVICLNKSTVRILIFHGQSNTRISSTNKVLNCYKLLPTVVLDIAL